MCPVSFNTTKFVLWYCLMIRPEASGVLKFDLSNSMSLECDFARKYDIQKTVCMDC